MRANVKHRLVERDILSRRTIRNGVLSYVKLPDNHNCGECRKQQGCRNICKKYGINYNGFGTEASTHCMFDPQIFET